MNRRMTPLLLVVMLAAMVLPPPATGLPAIAEVRGDFYYDAEGKLIGSRAASLPEGFERVPMSHKEKFQLMGIQLPERRAALEPRTVFPKLDRVREHARLQMDKVAVKFVDGFPIRMRAGALTASGGSLSDVEAILANYPEAVVSRTFSAAEYILDDNRETGETISGRELPDLNNFYMIVFPSPTQRSVELANELLALDIVETSYIEQAGEPPVCADVAPVTPLWEANQNYLNPAPDGIDAEYAWAYHAGGNGSSGYWVMDLEWEWCTTHEDLDFDVTDVVNGLTTGDPDAMNHGTAVIGVIGACDNGYGMTGIASDVTLKAADFDSETSWANNIGTADTFLVTGEVMLLEIHIGGPSTGTACPCNCLQFEMVPVEWNTASHAAIVTAVANGILVVEAAGNGSVDLDLATYGGWFALGNDSGAIMVGAAQNDGTHDVSCFSNHGATVDVHGYGDSVYTTGYGGLWNQTGCPQDYTSGFNGTSSASPIVTGAVASVQGVARDKYGTNISASQMRTCLRYSGTPQGAPAADNIGPMPDLVDALRWLAPDLVSDLVPAGWSYPAVPRATADATLGSVVLGAAALPGNVSSTYWNWDIENESYAYVTTALGVQSRLYVDDAYAAWFNGVQLAPAGWTYAINVGTSNVTGGRHTVLARADWDDIEHEYAEWNNDWARQYIWSPLALSEDSPQTRGWSPAAITTGYGPYYNAEGFSGSAASGSYWYAFAVMPTNSGSDFDVAVHSETPSNIPQAGFGAYDAKSSWSAGYADFVIIDQNTVGSGTYYGGVNKYSGTEANKIVEFDGDEGVVGLGTAGPFTLLSDDILELHEIYLSSGVEYRIEADWISGSADFGLSVYGEGAGYYRKSDYVSGGYAEYAPAGSNEVVTVAGDNSYHGIVVWKVDSTDRTDTLTYQLNITTNPNLTDTTPTGWYGPVVPRNTMDATSVWAPLPSVLDGNVMTTSYNFVTINEGPNTSGAPWFTHLYVDNIWYWNGTGSDLPSGAEHQWRNSAQGWDPYSLVRGGRHHIRVTADALGDVVERDEADNDYDEWFVWSPLGLADQTPVTRDAAPLKDPPGYGPYYSCDGFRTTFTLGSYWTATGVMPVNVSDDFDIRMHDKSTGSKDGFGANLATATDVAGRGDYVLVTRNTTPYTDVDLGIVNQNGGAGEFVIQQADGFLDGNFTGGVLTTAAFPLAAGRILSAHEFYLDTPGAPVYISLEHLSGSADLGIAVYDGNGGYFSKYADAMDGSELAPGGADEHVPGIVLPTAGYVGVVVFKVGSDDLPLANTYRIVISSDVLVDAVSTVEAPVRFALASPRPNPFTGATAIQYDAPRDVAHATLAVFDVQGRRVASLHDGPVAAGRHTTRWDARDSSGRRVSTGIYFVRFETPDFNETKKVVLLN